MAEFLTENSVLPEPASIFSPTLDSLEKPPTENLPLIFPDGDAVSGIFTQFADNWYRMNLDGNGVYFFETSAPESGLGVDTELRLFDEFFREVGYDDDGGDGTYSFLSEQLAAGEYYLRVSSYNRTGGNYSLLFDQDAFPSGLGREIPSGALGAGQALQLPINSPQQGLVDGDDPAWFQFTIDDGGAYTISTSEPSSGFDVATVIRLYAEDQETQLGEDDDGGSAAFSLLRENLARGTYYVSVSSYFLEPGEFTVTVEGPRRDDVGVVGAAGASMLEIDSPQPGSVNGDDPAWYQFTTTEEGAYTISTSEPGSGIGVDTVIRLYAEDQQTQLGEDDDGGLDGFSLLRADLPRGVYYLGVTSYFLEPGAFTIVVEGPDRESRR